MNLVVGVGVGVVVVIAGVVAFVVGRFAAVFVSGELVSEVVGGGVVVVVVVGL